MTNYPTLKKVGDELQGNSIATDHTITPQKPEVAPSCGDGWISVKDRLPEEGRKVFILDDYIKYPDNAWTGIYYGDGIWHQSNSISPYAEGHVTHWMPLPKAPKI